MQACNSQWHMPSRCRCRAVHERAAAWAGRIVSRHCGEHTTVAHDAHSSQLTGIDAVRAHVGVELPVELLDGVEGGFERAVDHDLDFERDRDEGQDPLQARAQAAAKVADGHTAISIAKHETSRRHLACQSNSVGRQTESSRLTCGGSLDTEPDDAGSVADAEDCSPFAGGEAALVFDPAGPDVDTRAPVTGPEDEDFGSGAAALLSCSIDDCEARLSERSCRESLLSAFARCASGEAIAMLSRPSSITVARITLRMAATLDTCPHCKDEPLFVGFASVEDRDAQVLVDVVLCA